MSKYGIVLVINLSFNYSINNIYFNYILLNMIKYPLSDREIVIAKIGIIMGVKSTGKYPDERAAEVLEIHCKKHNFSLEEANKLIVQIDKMFKDDLLT